MSRFTGRSLLSLHEHVAGLTDSIHGSANKHVSSHAGANGRHCYVTYLRGQYRRLVVRLGKKKAAVAVGHTILRLSYQLLTHETPYQEQELVQLDERCRTRTHQRAIDQLKALGYDVPLTPKEPAA